MIRALPLCVLALIVDGAVAAEPAAYSAEVPARRDEAGPPAFAKPVTATRVGEKVKIEFALSTPTDVAIYIEDSKGRIVRHLAAGVLGRNPPRPLKADSLSQSIEWDGTGDVGEPLPGGDYRVRVTAGMKVSYAGTAFSQESGPDHIGEVLGLAAGPDGRLYVMTSRRGWLYWGTTAVHVFRGGVYEKTVKPFPANLPMDQLRAAGAFRDKTGRINPAIHRLLGMTYYPHEDVPQQMAVTPAGQLLLAVVPAEQNKSRGPGTVAHLAAIDGDGGLPYESYAGPALLGESRFTRPCLAASPDGKCAYLTGLEAGPHAVYRVPLPERGPAEVFFGDPDKPGNDERLLDSPAGIACDGKGHLLVADRGNNRVVVINEKERRLAGSLAVEAPTWVGVHPGTGAVYVRGRGGVVKLSGWKAPKVQARLDLTPHAVAHRRFAWSVALDASAQPAVLWVGKNRGAGDPLLRFEDRSDRFTLAKRADYYLSPRQWNLTVDPTRRFVACRNNLGRGNTLDILNEATGRIRSISGVFYEGNTFRLGPDGRIYQLDHTLSRGGIMQRDRDGKPLPFPGIHSLRLPTHPSGTTAWERDFHIDRRGVIYAKQRDRRQPYHGLMRVDAFGPDGKFSRTVIWAVTDGALGPRVDPQGNLYLAEAIQPIGKPCPDELADHMTTQSQKHWTSYMYGSLIKFGPAGGATWFPPQPRYAQPLFPDGQKPARQYSYPFEGECKLDPSLKKEKVAYIMRAEPVDLQGALWWRFGFSPVADMNTGRGPCHCTGTDFDVDDFGRAFYPDQGRFRVSVLDTNGNRILDFGAYGNQDFCGPDSYVRDPKGNYLRPRRPDDPKGLVSPFAEPEIAFNWIVGVAVSDRYIYVADALNRRVLRCRLAHAAEATCRARWPGGPLDAVARVIDQVRREVQAASPHAAGNLDWYRLDLALRRRPATATLSDARRELCLALRDVKDLPPGDCRKLLTRYLADKAAPLRLAAVRCLDAEPARGFASELLKKATADEDDLVAVTAAIRLFRRGDQGGVSRILAGLNSKDSSARQLAEAALVDDLTEWAGPGTKAYEIYPNARTPKFAIGKAEIDALAPLLKGESWWLRRVAIYCLGVSGDRRVIEPVRAAIRSGEKGRNLCRLMGVLRVLRAREGASELLGVLSRAERDAEIGYECARRAADALAHIADPKSVKPLTGLLDEKRPPVRGFAHRALSRMFDPTVPAEACLMPRRGAPNREPGRLGTPGKLERIRVEKLPAPGQVRAAWEAFWKVNNDRYEWSETGPPLVSKTGNP